MSTIYYVSHKDTTDYEPRAGWYFAEERAEDSAPLIRGPFATRIEALEYADPDELDREEADCELWTKLNRESCQS